MKLLCRDDRSLSHPFPSNTALWRRLRSSSPASTLPWLAAMKRAQANLKRYRASVLKAACEGRLVPTEAELARDKGRDYEPADQLLERILVERRERWETQENRRGKYKEPVPHLTLRTCRDLPDEDGRVAYGLAQVTTEIQGGICKNSQNARLPKMPFLRISEGRSTSCRVPTCRTSEEVDMRSNCSLRELDKLRLVSGRLADSHDRQR